MVIILPVDSRLGSVRINEGRTAYSYLVLDTFNQYGQYNKTDWYDGQLITEAEMDKIEDCLYNNTKDLLKKFDDVTVERIEDLANNKIYIEMTFFSKGNVMKKIKFEGGGGSGGGVGEAPYISTTLTDNVLLPTGQDLNFDVYFTSPNLGNGTLKVLINNVEVISRNIPQEQTNITIPHTLLTKGNNVFKVYVLDRVGLQSNTLDFIVRYGSTELTTTFDKYSAYDYGSTIRYYFMATALDTSLSLTFYMKIDDVLQEGVACTSDVRGYYTFPTDLSVGNHWCEAYVEDSNGNKSNILTFNLVILDDTSLVVASDTKNPTIEEGEQLVLDYKVYMKDNYSFITKVYIDNILVNNGTCGLEMSYYRTSELTEGTHTIKLEVYDVTETVSDYIIWTVTVTESTYTMKKPIEVGTMFLASAINKSNSDEDREYWIGTNQNNEEIKANLYNFAFNNESGWVDDSLLISGNSYVEVPIAPLSNNARYGFTLDIEFTSKIIGVEDAEVLTLWNEEKNCGIKITTEQLILRSSEGNECTLYFSDNENVSAMFIIDRNEKTAKIYINGVMCSVFMLSDYVASGVSYLEDFTVNSNIILGGKDKNGYCAIKNLRVYEVALSTDEIINNFCANVINKTEQQKLVEFQKGNDLPTLTVYCDFSGLGKDDKKPCRIVYTSTNEDKYGKSFTLDHKESSIQYQGTSSMAYPIKNYRLNLRDENGDKWYYNPFNDGQPECRFTLKCDFMSSGHWQNTGLAKWINDNLYNYNPNDESSMNARKWYDIHNGGSLSDTRESINGFPCRLILVNDGNTPLNEGQNEPTPGNTKDMGVFNFNNDKDNVSTLGFDMSIFPRAMSFEVTANSDTSAGAFVPYVGLDEEEELAYLQQSFELRFPDADDVGSDYGYLDREYGLKRLVNWIGNSTDEEFLADFDQYLHRDYVLRYYLLVICCGMVDNLGKNCMWDSFDGKIWLPRFYDVDTICSYDNSGDIKFDVDIEMEQGYWNTSSSRLWTKVRDLMHEELVAKYNDMRQNGLSFESLMSYFYDEQIATIPQSYYNKDADVKYLPFADQYLGMAHGDGYEHLKRWLKNRLIFCDTLFDYAPSYNNDMLTIRANTLEDITLEIETYTPLYQHVSFYNGQMSKIKVDGKTATIFVGKAMTETDQEILIYGGSNIKRIRGISSANPNQMLIGGATRLVELEATNCPLLADINSNKANLSPHIYLNKVDLSGCPLLGGTLRLNNSPLIQNVNMSGTAINNIQLPSSIRNLEVLRLPNTLTDLTLRDASLLHTLIFDEGSKLQNISLINVNALTNTNLNFTTIPTVLLDNSFDEEELYMSATTNLTLNNMPMIQRLIYLPNNEYEVFTLDTLISSGNYKITTFNCPNLTDFITTAPQRLSYNGSDTEVKPNIVFVANTLDLSDTQFVNVKLLCTTDLYKLLLPNSMKNFYCDSAYDIENVDYDLIHNDLIEPYTTNYANRVSNVVIPSSSDGSLIFSMYAPKLVTEPSVNMWDLYGLNLNDFYTFGMNNDVRQDGTMPYRYAPYKIQIHNANIIPINYPTMLYPILVDTDSPIFGKIDYSQYKGTSLAWAFAYTNSEEVDRTLPSKVLKQVTNTYNVSYESDFIVHNPLEVANYTCNASGVLPTFNSDFKGYTVKETNNGNGTWTTSIMSNSGDNMPTSISFRYITSLLTVQNLNISNITSMADMFNSCSRLTSVYTLNWDMTNVTNIGGMFSNCTSLTEMDLSHWNTINVTNANVMFYNCNKLTKLDISFDIRNVTSADNMLDYTYNLTELNPPKNIDTDFSVNNSDLTVTSLLDIIDNLVNANGKVRRLALGNNRSKLTYEQIAVATNKGWIVS